MTGELFANPEVPSPLDDGTQQHAVGVALPVPIDQIFDYLPPAERSAALEPGCRVVVPFSGRKLTGIVVDAAVPLASAGAGARRLARIESVVDSEPAISLELLAVLREAAEQTLCPIGIALATALPAGSAPKRVTRLAATARGREALRSGAVRGPAQKILAALAREPLGERALARRVRGPGTGGWIAQLKRDRLIANQTHEQLGAQPRRERIARVAAGLDVEQVCRETLSRARRQAELLRRVAAEKEVATALLAAEHASAGAALRALAKRGFVEIDWRDAPRDVLGPAETPEAIPELTADQARVLEPLIAKVRAREAGVFLLHGVTGSGKTEVYLRAIASALDAGRQALVLVPEITLTHQIVARLRGRFGDELAVLHSGLNAGERVEQWERLRRGAAPIAVGARSALFAPLADVGVIVIDEEHDPAYKNDEGFRYHARDVAALRARHSGCPVILGSATPALETRYAAETGEIERLVLAHRIGDRPLPAVELVDLAAEKARQPRGRKLIVTRPLRQALAQTLADGGQSILFLNRRGFSTQVFCFECGHAERCQHCDVALVYHAGANELRCHYCDFTKPPPEQCGGCGAADTALLGVGTERLEEEIRTLLPTARIARLDRDTAARRGYTASVLHALRAGQLDILVGTQIVAKGHDFPGVRLVGVIAADLGLHMPDFRAAERTFQLLTQVAGRAGRDKTPGRVIVQTFVPEHYALAPVRKHDYERFYRDEIAHRRELGYPPFGHLAYVVVSSEDEAQANEVAALLAQHARTTVAAAAPGGAAEVLGPAPAALARLRGRHRVQLLVKTGRRETVMAAARAMQSAAERVPKTVQVSVDANPMSLL